MKIRNILVEMLFYLYILIKPFYFFKSGSIQIGDIFLCLSFIVLSFIEKKISIKKIDKPLLIYIIIIFFINLIYSIVLRDFTFSRSSLFYMFNSIMIILFRNLVNERFLKNISSCFMINIVIQFIISIINVSPSIRYRGTYNDPNQFAFAILSAFFMIVCINKIDKKKVIIIALMTLYLINASASTGMMIAYFILVITNICLYVYKINNKINKSIYLTIIFIMVIFILVILPIIINNPPKFLQENFTFNRIISKLNFNGGNSLIKDRNQNVVFENLHIILFGSGEGNMSRFPGNIANLEIHSTWLSMLFYYGIGPFLLFLYWLKNNIKNCDIQLIAMYIALFIEGFTLVNQRQGTFWMLIIIGYYIKNEKGNKKFNDRKSISNYTNT